MVCFCLSQDRIFGILVPTPKHRRNKYSQYLCMNYAVFTHDCVYGSYNIICIYTAPSAPLQEVQVFTSPDQTSIEFGAVVSDIAEVLNSSCVGDKLEKVKLLCTHTTDKYNIPIFSQREINTIKKSKSIFDIFDVIRPHWSWNSHHLLPVIIKRVGSTNALELFKKFEAKIKYNQKLKEINDMFKIWNKPVPPEYCKMIGIVDKDYDEIVLEDCFTIDTYISETLGQFQCVEYNRSDSVEFVWLVPVAAVEGLHEKALHLNEALQKKLFMSLKIDGVIVFDSRIPTLEVQCMLVYKATSISEAFTSVS